MKKSISKVAKDFFCPLIKDEIRNVTGWKKEANNQN